MSAHTRMVMQQSGRIILYLTQRPLLTSARELVVLTDGSALKFPCYWVRTGRHNWWNCRRIHVRFRDEHGNCWWGQHTSGSWEREDVYCRMFAEDWRKKLRAACSPRLVA